MVLRVIRIINDNRYTCDACVCTILNYYLLPSIVKHILVSASPHPRRLAALTVTS